MEAGVALEEQTRERVPLQWAMTQNNLGNALFRLGERESVTARLEEAVAAYRAALERLQSEAVPAWPSRYGPVSRAVVARALDAATCSQAVRLIP
jgi:hypothetical protein